MTKKKKNVVNIVEQSVKKKVHVTIKSDRKFDKALVKTLEDIGNLLIEKNIKYGDSVLNPVRIFSRADIAEQIRVRIDDKISRLVRGNILHEDEDVITDLTGYLIILQMVIKYIKENN